MLLLLGFFLSCSFMAQAQRPELRRPQDQQGDQPAPPAKKSKRSARAIGVVEFLPGGGIRLVPVALWYEGKYYDASLYQANPAPLALEPGTVYQALSDGELAGQFVVNMPKLSNSGWIGDGRWTTRRALDEQLAAEAAMRAKPAAKQSKAIFTGDADQGPPVLRRPGSEQSSTAAQAAAPAPAAAPPASTKPSQSSTTESTTTSDTASARPTLGRPGDEPASAAPPVLQPVNSAPQSGNTDDPDRPVFHKPTASAAPNSTAKQPAQSPASDENDPDRPVLTHGSQATPPPAKANPSFATTNAKGAKPASKDSSTHSLAAVSDASKFETRPLVYTTTPERQQELAHTMAALALVEVRAFGDKHTPGPKVPKNAAITDYDLRFFDLDFSNSPTLVFTGKLPVAATGSRPFFYYITCVARLDINGEPVKVFSSVTDTMHLDVFPRMELIDAIDADANGRGDLFFRQHFDRNISYALYRVFPYNMEKLFEGGASL